MACEIASASALVVVALAYISIQTCMLKPGRCITQEEVMHHNAYDAIRNDALNFCAGLYANARHTAVDDESASSIEIAVQEALQRTEAENICRTALVGQVAPEAADKELLGLEGGVKQQSLPAETRAFRVLGQKTQASQTWQQLLSKVCKDECHDLVEGMKDSKVGSKLGFAEVGMSADSVPKVCADLVVRKVEAEALTCCGLSCGWNQRTCRFWPYMTSAEKEDWNARCCSENTILRNSTRERLCNSVLPKGNQQEMESLDPEPNDAKDAERIGQDEPEDSSMLQHDAQQVQELGQLTCSAEVGKNCHRDQRQEFLTRCNEDESLNWSFIQKKVHEKIKRHATESVAGGQEGMAQCVGRLTEVGASSVSWEDGTCFFVSNKEDNHVKNLYQRAHASLDHVDAAEVVLFKYH